MVYWVTGRKGSGKTTMAKRLALQTGGVVLDGDDIRQLFPQDYTAHGRYANQENLANLARLLEKQGFVVIISCVSPIHGVRMIFQEMFDQCIEIEMPFGELWEGTVYEESPMKEIEIGEVKDYARFVRDHKTTETYDRRSGWNNDPPKDTTEAGELPGSSKTGDVPLGVPEEHWTGKRGGFAFSYTDYRCPTDEERTSADVDDPDSPIPENGEAA